MYIIGMIGAALFFIGFAITISVTLPLKRKWRRFGDAAFISGTLMMVPTVTENILIRYGGTIPQGGLNDYVIYVQWFAVALGLAMFCYHAIKEYRFHKSV